MLSYETLDAIADSYIPSLAVIALVFIAASLFKSQWRQAGLRFAGFAAMVVIAYSLMFLDHRLNIWPAFGLDYSTHTAVALGLVLFHSFTIPRFTYAWIGSLVGYALLMLYQRYHTISDIVTTGIAVGVPMVLCLLALYSPWRSKAVPSHRVSPS